MKSWTLDDALQRDHELSTLVDRTKPLMEDEIGPAAQSVDARWTLDPAGGQSPLVLRLSDETSPDGVWSWFSRRELDSIKDARRRFRWIWGDLLQARSHKQIEALLQAGG